MNAKCARSSTAGCKMFEFESGKQHEGEHWLLLVAEAEAHAAFDASQAVLL
jgi:hypothetical protein